MERDECLSRFDVAVWENWPPLLDEFPFVGVVSALNAAAAVVAVMQAYGLTTAGHVAARDLDRRFMHRANDVVLWEDGAFIQQARDAELAAKQEAQDRAEYEEELLAARVTPEQFDQETGRLYPNVMGNGHPDVCLCPSCAPWEYE